MKTEATWTTRIEQLYVPIRTFVYQDKYTVSATMLTGNIKLQIVNVFNLCTKVLQYLFWKFVRFTGNLKIQLKESLFTS